MWNARLDEAQAGIKIAGRNINNLRYANDTTFMAESEELKSLLMKEENEKIGLKLKIQKTKITWRGSRLSWCISGWGRSHEDIRDIATWMVTHAKDPDFPVRSW